MFSSNHLYCTHSVQESINNFFLRYIHVNVPFLEWCPGAQQYLFKKLVPDSEERFQSLLWNLRGSTFSAVVRVATTAPRKMARNKVRTPTKNL